MQTTVVRGDPRDVIAYAFYRIGYRPRESVILLGIDEDGLTRGTVVRADLPRGREDPGATVGQLLHFVTTAADERVLALVVSGAHFAQADAPHDGRGADPDGAPHDGRGADPDGGARPDRLAHGDLVRHLRARLARRGVEVVEVLAVGPAAFSSYLCEEEGCCPPAPRPLGDLTTTRVATEMVLQGHVLAEGESALVADVEPARTPAVPGSALGAGAGRAAALARWRALLDPPAGDDGAATPAHEGGDLGWLVDALTDDSFRDAVILTLLPGAGSVPDEVAAGSQCRPPAALFAARPDPELLERGRVPLAQVARSAPPGHRAQALAVLAWLAWWSGSGARARLLVERALRDSPGHRLASILGRMLLHGVPPEWVTADHGRG